MKLNIVLATDENPLQYLHTNPLGSVHQNHDHFEMIISEVEKGIGSVSRIYFPMLSYSRHVHNYPELPHFHLIIISEIITSGLFVETVERN